MMRKLFSLFALIALTLLLTNPAAAVELQPAAVAASDQLTGMPDTVLVPSAAPLVPEQKTILEPAENVNLAAAGETDKEGFFNALSTAIQNRAVSVDVAAYHVSSTEGGSVIDEFFAEHREMFYVSCKTLWNNGTYVTSCELTYSYDASQVAAYEAKVEDILQQVIFPGMNTMQKALALHDYLAVHVAYDYENYTADAVPDVSHNSYGAIVLGIAVCDGYSYAYDDLLSRCGVECGVVTGLGDVGAHAWNQVKLDDGNWYHVDVTWDDPIPDLLGQCNHDNFLCSDSKIISMKHTIENADNTCTSTVYDDDSSFWAGLHSALVFLNADTVYYMDSNISAAEQTISLVKRDWDSASESTQTSLQACWYVWNSTSNLYLDSFARLCRVADQLYFNDALHVYSYDLNGGTCSVVYDYSGADGYIYGLAELANGLNCEIRTDLNTSVKVVPVPLTLLAASVDNGTISWRISSYAESSSSLLVIAQYSVDGQMLNVKTVAVSGAANGTADFAAAVGCRYSLFLLQGETFAPLKNQLEL